MANTNLILGDCLEKMKDIESRSIDLILTDPPYGTTRCHWDSVISLEPMWRQIKRTIKPNKVIALTCSQPFTSVLIVSNIEMFKYCWVYQKSKATNYLLAKKMPMKYHEDIAIFYNGRSPYYPIKTKGKPWKRKFGGDHREDSPYYNGTRTIGETYTGEGRYPSSIIPIISNPSGKGQIHSSQKPIELMEYLINTYTEKGQIVLDFTMGSGTTGVACVKTKRNFIGIEIDEEYFEIAKNRIESQKIIESMAIYRD